MTKSLSLSSASLLAALAALALPAHSAEVTLTVTTLTDNARTPPAGSLRAAINTANANPGNSYVINFNIAGGGTLTLSSGLTGVTAAMLPILTNPSGISIDGANGGQGAITIHGGVHQRHHGRPHLLHRCAHGHARSRWRRAGLYRQHPLQHQQPHAAERQCRRWRRWPGGRAPAARGLGGAVFVNAGHLTLSGVTMAGNQANGGGGRLWRRSGEWRRRNGRRRDSRSRRCLRSRWWRVWTQCRRRLRFVQPSGRCVQLAPLRAAPLRAVVR